MFSLCWSEQALELIIDFPVRLEAMGPTWTHYDSKYGFIMSRDYAYRILQYKVLNVKNMHRKMIGETWVKHEKTQKIDRRFLPITLKYLFDIDIPLI